MQYIYQISVESIADTLEFMLVGTYQSLAKVPDIRIHINNEPLKQLTVSKYLCMKIDSNLKWDDHINAIIPKISSKIGILRPLRKIVPIETLKLLFNAIVQPHFDYSDISMTLHLKLIRTDYKNFKQEPVD